VNRKRKQRTQGKERSKGRDALLVIVSMAAPFVVAAETWWCCPV